MSFTSHIVRRPSHPRNKVHPGAGPRLPSLSEIETLGPDAHIFARAIADVKKALKHPVGASVVEVAEAITSIQFQFMNTGASQITVTMLDPHWDLLDSGFFDAADDGRLDRIDVQYPGPDSGSPEYWWTCSQCSPTGRDHTIQLVFIPKVAFELMQKKGPMKANRAKMTRAEFIKKLVEKASPEAEFYCEQLNKKQPIDSAQQASKKHSKAKGKARRTVGLGASAGGLTCKGQPLNSSQIGIINVALGEAERLNAPTNARIAMIYASMGESNIHVSSGGGVWQDLSSPNPNDIRAEANAFLTGKFGFQQGGAIACANRGDPPWQIANEVEANLVWSTQRADSYAPQWAGSGKNGIAEATAIVQQGGGGSAGGTVEVTTVEPYFFKVGANETYWAAAQRLASEVAWDLIVDGPRVYYDAETTYIRAKPVVELHRDDESVIDWNGTWDIRQKATQWTVNVLCDPFEFRCGDSLHLVKMGPGSSGSSVKPPLPGRWLIQQIDRDRGALDSTLTLKQPTPPKREPAPQTSTRSVSAGAGGVARTVGGVTNPAPGATWGRLDMGFDGNYGPQGLVAPYSGTIHIPGEGGWPGQGVYFYIVNDDQSGPNYTRAMYFAEGATPIVPNGAHVNAGQKIGNPVASGGNGTPGNYEIGPANTSNGDCLVKQYGLGSATSRQIVISFQNWLVAAGAQKSPNPSNAGAP